MTYSVSVIIPNYNHGRYLGQAIESVLQQSLPPHEVIVVDDGSTDDSIQALRQLRDRVQVIQQMNQGVASARNNGAWAATGNYLAFLDADDLWLPEKLAKQIERFRSAPTLGMVHCGIVEFDNGGRLMQEHLDGLEGWVAKELMLFRRPVVIGTSSTGLFARRAFEEGGGYDLRLSTSADWDLCCRIAQRYPIGFVPEVLVQYRMHGSNMHANVQAMKHDMLLAFETAFRTSDPHLLRLRRRCYGNLHTTLAGSFFKNGEYWQFLQHALKATALTPDNITRFLEYPLRRLQPHRRKLLNQMH